MSQATPGELSNPARQQAPIIPPLTSPPPAWKQEAKGPESAPPEHTPSVTPEGDKPGE